MPPRKTKKSKKALSRRRTGRPVIVAGDTHDIGWQEANLRAHYDKHPAGRDRDCWLDLLNRSSGQVLITEYEEESYDAVENARLHYRKFDPDEDRERRDVFVDARLLQSITNEHKSAEELTVVSCFHKHFGSPYRHVVGAHRDTPEEQLLREYRRRLDRDADANHIELKFYREDYE